MSSFLLLPVDSTIVVSGIPGPGAVRRSWLGEDGGYIYPIVQAFHLRGVRNSMFVPLGSDLFGPMRWLAL